MPTATFYPEDYHSIDLTTPNNHIGNQFELGVMYFGGNKNMLRRSFLVFDVFGPAAEGRPLTPADALTAADLLTVTDLLFGTTGWAATIKRIDRAGYDPGAATWNTYDGVNAWASLGGDFNTPTLGVISPTIASTPHTIANLLPFVTDAIASRSGKVRIALYANNENPGSNAFWPAIDGSSSDRARLRVTWESADPTPIAEPVPGLGGDRPARVALEARPARPVRPPTLRPRLA